jgi:heme exporter protein D
VSHAAYVAAAYGIAALVLAGLLAWLFLDYRGRRRDLADLEARGVGRRARRGERE